MIKAYAELIRDISGDNREKREAHLAVISAESDRLTELVSDILALSQVQSGGMALELKETDLGQIARRVMSRFEPLLEKEGARFEAAVELQQMALADERRIEQVLYNLIGNAVNHIGEDKTVYVTVAQVPGAVRVTVADHGEGIAEEDLPRIWERYYKAKNHVRAKAGTGLGLSIVKGILELHGAKYGVDSRLGEGSTFWFELGR
jgi:signal transduction histidine kinase